MIQNSCIFLAFIPIEMIKRELNKIVGLQKQFSDLTVSEVERMSLKQDFYQFSAIQKESLFESLSRPEDKICSLADEHEEGSYDELEVVEHKMQCLLSNRGEMKIDKKLESWYLGKRKEIVESGTTYSEIEYLISQISGSGDDQQGRMFPVKLEHSSPHISNQNHKFLWQFLDDLLENSGVNNKEFNQQTSYHQPFNEICDENKQMDDKKTENESCQLLNLYRRLLALVQKDRDEQLMKLISESQKSSSQCSAKFK